MRRRSSAPPDTRWCPAPPGPLGSVSPATAGHGSGTPPDTAPTGSVSRNSPWSCPIPFLALIGMAKGEWGKPDVSPGRPMAYPLPLTRPTPPLRGVVGFGPAERLRRCPQASVRFAHPCFGPPRFASRASASGSLGGCPRPRLPMVALLIYAYPCICAYS